MSFSFISGYHREEGTSYKLLWRKQIEIDNQTFCQRNRCLLVIVQLIRFIKDPGCLKEYILLAHEKRNITTSLMYLSFCHLLQVRLNRFRIALVSIIIVIVLL